VNEIFRSLIKEIYVNPRLLIELYKAWRQSELDLEVFLRQLYMLHKKLEEILCGKFEVEEE